MGLLPQMILLAIYFLISRFWTIRKWMLMLFLPVSGMVFLLGYLNRFGIYPIDMKMQNANFISTIGNINWYCGYLVSVLFGGYFLFWRKDCMKTSKKSEKEMFVPTASACLKGWKQIVLILYVAVGFVSLTTQGSMSGLFALAALLVVTFCLSANGGEKMLSFWQSVLLLSLTCLMTLCIRRILHRPFNYEDAIVDLLTDSAFPVIATVVTLVIAAAIAYCNAHTCYPAKLFRILAWIVGAGTVIGICVTAGMIALNTWKPGSLGKMSEYAFFTFSGEWGSNRGATWKAGILCFREQNLLHKLIGVGPDCMELFIKQNGSSRLLSIVRERFGNNRLTNAHNEWLTILVNTGILGCIGYVGMILSAIVRFLRKGIKGKQDLEVSEKQSGRQGDVFDISGLITGACGFCLLAYTLNNLFSFQQSMSVATIFVILGIGEAYARSMRLSLII